jgi:AraC-like DNA-binding protein
VSGSVPAVALDGCRIWRPMRSVEIVSADARLRAFPTRTSRTLGICLKAGGSHAVRADGRSLTYPADAICIRPPGCVWSSEAAVAGFWSIDIASEWLPDEVNGTMMFGAARHLPDLVSVARRLRYAASVLETEIVVADLMTAIRDAGALDLPAIHDHGRGARGARQAREFLAAHAHDNPTLEEIARHAGMNKFVLLRWFRRVFGITPHTFLMAVRVDRARALLAAGMSAAESSLVTGFADQAHFSRWFKRLVGITPTAYARQTADGPRSISFKTDSAPRR